MLLGTFPGGTSGDVVEVQGIYLSTPNDDMTGSTYGLVHKTFIEASDLIVQKDQRT